MKQYTLTLLLVLLSATCIPLQSRAASRTVREIRFVNHAQGTLNTSVINAHTKARTGEELGRNTIAHDVRALLDTGLFSDVKVSIIPHDDGVILVYGFVNRWTLMEPIEVKGQDRLRARRIRNLVNLSPGDLVDDQVLGAHTRALVDEYARYHYNHAKISWTIHPVNKDLSQARVRLTINEGRKEKVRKFGIQGNQSIKRRDLLDTVHYPNWWNPFRFFKSLDYEADDLTTYRVAMQDAYRDRGYLDTHIAPLQVTRIPGKKPVIQVKVQEGEPYYVGKVTISGITLFPQPDVARAAARVIKPGNVASMRAIGHAASAIRDYYESKGYLRTRVAHTLTPHEDNHTTDIHFTVKEGVLTHLRNILIQGNDRTRDKVLRRELLAYPGEIYDGVKVQRSENRLRNLGFFSRVDALPLDTAWENQKDLLIDVEEKPTGQFMVGAGFSSIDKAIGFLEVSQGNFDLKNWPRFTGGGQKLRLRGELGKRRTEFDISFVEPWFLDRKLALGFDLYRSEVDYDEYDLKRTGFSPSLAKSLPGRNRIELRYRIETREVTDTSDTNQYVVVESGEPYSFNRVEDTMQSSFRLTFLHDTRNRSFVPTRGTRASVFYEMAGGLFGGDAELYRIGTRWNQFFSPWLSHVISLRFRYEVVEEYGDSYDLSISDRLFLGGGRSLRGFEYRDVGPKAVPVGSSATTDYRPVGGKSLAFASAEYTIPIVKGIRLAGFVDAGNVWTDAYEIQPDDIASTAGIGFRFDLPGFPIRIDRAWVIDSDDELTEEDPWVFWIGY